MKKLNNKQKEHIKKVFVKTINIFCYICTGILAVILLVVCLQGCQNKPQKVSAENLNTETNTTYVLKYAPNTEVDLTYSNIIKLNNSFGLPSSNVYGTQVLYDSRDFVYDLPSNTQLFSFDSMDFLSIDKLTFRFVVYGSGSELYWRFDTLRFNNTSAPIYDSILYKKGTSYNSYVYTINEFYFLVSDKTLADISGIDLFFYVDTQSHFSFNKDFNYNAPLSVSPSSPFGASVIGSDGGTLISKVIIDTRYFVSNNRVFNQIQAWYEPTDASYFNFNGDIKLGSTGMWFYRALYYVNTETDDMILVNSRNQIAFMPSSSSYGYYWDNSSTWTIDSYRHITLLQYQFQSTIDKLEQFNNNNQTSTGGNVVSGEVNNVFTLVGSALTGLLPILTTTILPGITIGTLLFIPLVALLVFAIIRIIKK